MERKKLLVYIKNLLGHKFGTQKILKQFIEHEFGGAYFSSDS